MISLGVVIVVVVIVLRNGAALMASVKELKDQLQAVADGVNALEAGIKDLKAQVAAGGVASQADLDELSAKAAEIVADLKDTSDQ